MNFGSPASIAGLPGNNACVKVGPPLSCSKPEHRIRIDLVAGAGQITAAIIAAQDYSHSEVTVPPALKMFSPKLPAFRMVLPSSSTAPPPLFEL